ncbi:MAG: 50S ribosomal protein L6 [Nanoarchaeota archaeon]|nr:50S ribosomal protein L6 [Nanoarchaeota archaeon]
MEKTIPVLKQVTVKREGKELVFTKDGKENRRQIFHPLIDVIITPESITLKAKKENRNVKKLMNTYASHINNLMRGLIKPFVYQLKIAGSHFPITVKQEGKNILISNYLGEKVPRKCKIVGNANVKVAGDIITVESTNKEHAGMTAGIIEKTGQIRIHDRRIFQDGIYLIKKAGNDNE